MNTSFTIGNDRGLDLLCNTHVPEGDPVACVIMIHGYKGYKDYGFIPIMAHDLCARGVLVHRFNLSTSGMTNDTKTFARPDLFELDTWMRQVEDVRRMHAAIDAGEIAGHGLPRLLVGHSRGGAAALLTAGMHRETLGLCGVVTINAVDRCCRMNEDDQRAMLERGYTLTQSARTGQTLRINSRWLREQMENPEAHDVLLQTSQCGVAVCVMHGDADDAVDICAGVAIANCAKTPLIVLEDSNHVLNMPNPGNLSGPRSVPFLKAVDEMTRFIGQQVNPSSG